LQAFSDSRNAIGRKPYADGGSGGVAQFMRLADIVYPDGSQINYNYVAGVDSIMSRISNIEEGSGPINAAYSYLGAERIVTENYEEPQVKLDYSANNFQDLDQFGRVLDQVWSGYGSGNSGTLDGYGYTYYSTGDRLSQVNQTNAALDETFTYDSLDRLISWSLNGTQQESWNLDSLGNDLNAGKYDASNEETPTAGGTAYDLAGNMTTLKSGDTAVYDAWDRLVKVESGSTVLETCEYDGTGRRVQVVNSGTTTDDYYAGQQLVESDITGGSVGGYQYVWSPRYIDAPVFRETVNSGHNGIVSGTRDYYLGDANYNVTGLVSGSTGLVIEHYSYTPYGVVSYYDTVGNNPWTSTGSSANGNTILYSGHQLDTAISLYYCRARFYDPSLQRFVSQDPMGFTAGDDNLYRYCGNAPTDTTDPSGEDICLMQGNASGNLANDTFHRQIRVDTWQMRYDRAEKKMCWKRTGSKSYSFGVDLSEGEKHFPSSKKWLGWQLDVEAPAGEYGGGKIYVAHDVGVAVETHKTTPEQDVKWKRYMDTWVDHEDRYQLLQFDCMVFSTREYNEAPQHY